MGGIRQYTLNVELTSRGTFPSQCISIVPSGSTLVYESPSGSPSREWTWTTQTFTSSITVFAQHVNGYNYLSTSSPSSTSRTSSTTSTTSQTGLVTGTRGAKTNGNGISGGAKAGIAIGVVLAVLLGGVGLWFIARKRRRQADSLGVEQEAAGAGPFEMQNVVVKTPVPTYEMESGPLKTPVRELAFDRG
jgi:hypothetical protein